MALVVALLSCRRQWHAHGAQLVQLLAQFQGIRTKNGSG
jgi:hypothetical protein